MGTIQITIKDETATGKVIGETSISVSGERMTVKGIIEARVIAEVEEYNSKMPEMYKGLVKPLDAEIALNGYRIKDRKKVDAEKQVYIALNAFQKNGFFVLIDNIQAEDLDQQVALQNGTSVSFVKLTPLVGG